MASGLPALQFPLVNGVYYDYSSIEIVLKGVRFSGIKSIGYKHSLKPGNVRGTRAQKVGRTRGEYESEGSLEVYLAEWEAFTTLLNVATGKGYFEAEFDTFVTYVEPTTPGIKVDQLVGCRLTSAEQSHSEGGDALVVKCDFDVMYIKENGKSPLSSLLP